MHELTASMIGSSRRRLYSRNILDDYEYRDGVAATFRVYRYQPLSRLRMPPSPASFQRSLLTVAICQRRLV